MKTEFKKMSLSRILLAGILCGIITAVIDVIYAGFYRDATYLKKYAGIGPTTIFVGIPFLLLVAAGIYYLLVHYFNKGEIFFIVVFAAAMLLGMAVDMNFHRSSGQTTLSTPHGFLFGMEVITGLAICIFLPYLAHHPKIYMSQEEMKWE